MCLRFAYLLITRMASWLRLSQHEESWKTAEILLLRHQLAVVRRRQPHHRDLDWTDRSLLAALLTVIPKARRHGLRLPVTPDTILRWHRDIIHPGSGRRLSARTGQPRRAPDPPQAGPRRTRTRILLCWLTAHRTPESHFRAPQGSTPSAAGRWWSETAGPRSTSLFAVIR
jgi:hypothetical protein